MSLLDEFVKAWDDYVATVTEMGVLSIDMMLASDDEKERKKALCSEASAKSDKLKEEMDRLWYAGAQQECSVRLENNRKEIESLKTKGDAASKEKCEQLEDESKQLSGLRAEYLFGNMSDTYKAEEAIPVDVGVKEETVTGLKELQSNLEERNRLDKKNNEIDKKIKNELSQVERKFYDQKRMDAPESGADSIEAIEQEGKREIKKVRGIVKVVAAICVAIIMALAIPACLSIDTATLQELGLIHTTDPAQLDAEAFETRCGVIFTYGLGVICLFFATFCTSKKFLIWIVAGAVWLGANVSKYRVGAAAVSDMEWFAILASAVLVSGLCIWVQHKVKELEKDTQIRLDKERERIEQEMQAYEKCMYEELSQLISNKEQELHVQYAGELEDITRQLNDVNDKIRNNSVLEEKDKQPSVVNYVLDELESDEAASVQEALLHFSIEKNGKNQKYTNEMPGRNWDIMSITFTEEIVPEIEKDAIAMVRYLISKSADEIEKTWLFKEGPLILQRVEDMEKWMAFDEKMKSSNSWILTLASNLVLFCKTNTIKYVTATQSGAEPELTPLVNALEVQKIRKAQNSQEDKMLKAVIDFCPTYLKMSSEGLEKYYSWN